MGAENIDGRGTRNNAVTNGRLHPAGGGRVGLVLTLAWKKGRDAFSSPFRRPTLFALFAPRLGMTRPSAEKQTRIADKQANA